jgi:hypothetical protein
VGVGAVVIDGSSGFSKVVGKMESEEIERVIGSFRDSRAREAIDSDAEEEVAEKRRV